MPDHFNCLKAQSQPTYYFIRQSVIRVSSLSDFRSTEHLLFTPLRLWCNDDGQYRVVSRSPTFTHRYQREEDSVTVGLERIRLPLQLAGFVDLFLLRLQSPTGMVWGGGPVPAPWNTLFHVMLLYNYVSPLIHCSYCSTSVVYKMKVYMYI